MRSQDGGGRPYGRTAREQSAIGYNEKTRAQRKRKKKTTKPQVRKTKKGESLTL